MNSELHALIDIDRIVQRTVELVQLPSVNPFDGPASDTTGETGVAMWMAGHLDRLGFATTLSDVALGRPNVVGTLSGTDGPSVALAGHTDTVGVEGCDDPFSGRVADGRIFGRGTCDMKGALAVFVEVAEVLVAAQVDLAGDLMIAGVADEEHGMIGSAALGAAGQLADHVIVGEPTELDVCSAHKGQYAFPIRTFGTAVHSSIADQGVNAIDSMMAIMQALSAESAALAEADPHPLCGYPTLNVGTIRGGNMVSIVPDYCEIEVDRRVVPGESTKQIRARFTDLLQQLSEDDEQIRWEIGDAIVDAGPLFTDENHPLVVAAVAAMGQHGVAKRPSSFTGSTDAPNLRSPAIIWGPGSLALAHTTNESIAVDELELAAKAYLEVVTSLLAR